jgi:hypothetical protein
VGVKITVQSLNRYLMLAVVLVTFHRVSVIAIKVRREEEIIVAIYSV